MIKELAIEQIEEARRYTESLIAEIPESDWYRFPAGGVTNVAWQVAHLAMAEYRLGLDRVRGTLPDDETLISSRFLEQYGKGSVPVDDPAKNSPIAEIRATLDRVHRKILAESANWSDDSLQETILKPHRLFSKKIDALWWCGRHEMLHAGQIGLVRRMLGNSPIW